MAHPASVLPTAVPDSFPRSSSLFRHSGMLEAGIQEKCRGYRIYPVSPEIPADFCVRDAPAQARMGKSGSDPFAVYRDLRKRGITVRKPVDCMIASVAIEYDLRLLHNDRDFNRISKHWKLEVLPGSRLDG